MEQSQSIFRKSAQKKAPINPLLVQQDPDPDKIFQQGAGITRPLKLFIFDLVQEAQLNCESLDDRAKFIKFYLEQKESKHWNIFIFDGPLFGKRCSASDNKYLLFRSKKIFYLIWFTKL